MDGCGDWAHSLWLAGGVKPLLRCTLHRVCPCPQSCVVRADLVISCLSALSLPPLMLCRVGLCGWGNHEQQTYTLDSHRVQDGVLMITVRRG